MSDFLFSDVFDVFDVLSTGYVRSVGKVGRAMAADAAPSPVVSTFVDSEVITVLGIEL